MRDKHIIKRRAAGKDVEIVLPIIHLNGNSRQSLLDEIEDARQALIKGREALANAAPNGRNYYPVSGLWEKAEAQHRQRMAMLTALLQDLEYEAIAIADDQFNGDEL